MESAPKDSRIIRATWFENGEPQEIWPVRWDANARNGLFPGVVGMWIVPDGSATWNSGDGHGPTHWMPHNV